jgi:uncharacterized membrane protein YkoI
LEEKPMKRSVKAALVVGAVVVATGATVGIAAAGGSDDSEGPITGSALDKASAAALAETGGGKVTDTEVGDEESYYEVEVTMPDGEEIDVQLDESFNVVGSESETGDEDEGSNDD